MNDWDKTLVIDFDNTLCESRSPEQRYCEIKPKEDAAKTLKALREEGWKIIIYTASGMGTYNGDVSKIIQYRVPEIRDWLNSHDIPFDEIVAGKMLAHYYIDDRAIEFKDNWIEIKNRILK